MPIKLKGTKKTPPVKMGVFNMITVKYYIRSKAFAKKVTLNGSTIEQ